MRDARPVTEDEKVTRCGICGQWTWDGLCTLCGSVVRGGRDRQNTVNPGLTVNPRGEGARDGTA